MTLRSLLFWIHFVAGVVAGAIIAVMSFTGAALAFEKELVAYAERDAAHVAVPDPMMARLPIATLIGKVQDLAGAPVSAIVVRSDPTSAVVVTIGRDEVYYVSPYTGEAHRAPARRSRAFFRTMIGWHRWLGREGEGRATGRAITGACNLAFSVLVVSGLYLWWPRTWRWPAVRRSTALQLALRGKARDWNWHTVLGFWFAPVLLVLSATGVVISYRWAGNLAYALTGTAPPLVSPGRAGSAATRLSLSALDAAVKNIAEQFPNWQSITFRSGPAPEPRRSFPQKAEERPRQIEPSSSIASAATVVTRDQSHRFAPPQVTLDARTGAVVQVEGYASWNAGRKLRSWLRFLHTGEALGPVGKACALIGCIVGLVLVWTGLALAVRRVVAALRA